MRHFIEKINIILAFIQIPILMNTTIQPESRAFVPKAPEHLRKKMASGDVVPFIGAGISMGAELPKGLRMPSYKTLLENLLTFARPNMEDNIYNDCLALLNSGELLQAGDLIETTLNVRTLHELLREALNHLQPKPSTVHELLNLYDFPIIFTSNYDRILETSLYPTPEVVTYRDSVSMVTLLGEKSPFIFKIHGDLTRPETIVLGWSRYNKLHGKGKRLSKEEKAIAKSLDEFIGGILQHKTLLFLGCSFADGEYSEYFLNYAKTHGTTGRHYALVEKNSVTLDQKNQWRKALGVEIIEYVPDQTYSQVWEFLASLKPQQKNVSPIAGQSYENFYLLYERADYLKEQLATEKLATSCRFLTPGITNCLATEDYIRIICAETLNKYKEELGEKFDKFKNDVLENMWLRAKNIEEKLEQDNFEFRSIFLIDKVKEELALGDPLIVKRYHYILELIKKHPKKLRLRTYGHSIDNKEYMKSTYALIFFGSRLADIGYFYAPQATTNKFAAHMMQINTKPVTERVEHFERYWVNSLSEEMTITMLEDALKGK